MLNLSQTDVGEEGARLLAASPNLPCLAELRLAGMWTGGSSSNLPILNEQAAALLFQSPHLAQLTTLDLSLNELGPQAALALASSSTLKQLTPLELEGNRIGDDGASALAGSPILANVFFLDLSGNRIGCAGGQALVESPYLQPGITLRLTANSLDAPDLAMLRERFGDRLELAADIEDERY